MKDVKMIALDMDGTLLDSGKKLLPETIRDIDLAADAGKTVILCTGRGRMEVEEYRSQLRSVRYAILLSGALLYDFSTDTALYEKRFDADEAKSIVAVAEKYDGMIHYLTVEQSIVRADQCRHMADYQMSDYQELTDRVSEPVEDIIKSMETTGLPLKMLISFRSPEDRKWGMEEIKDLPVVLVPAEKTSLEISPLGVDKGNGLKRLAGHLDVDLNEIIAIGDAPNDIEMLKTAGYSIAMGNASDEIRVLCDEVTVDNNHNGAGMAIRKHL